MQPIHTLTLQGNHPVRHYRFDNGFEALLVHNPISPVCAYLTHYTVGSASESDGERGLAHFFEHMMFRETARLRDGDFDRIIAEIGGVGLNAFTAYDTTAYHVSLPTAQLERVIDLEADRMINLRLSPELIEIERGAVLGEINMYQDMPSEQLWNAMAARAYAHHPYQHPVIGYTEQVQGFAQGDFERFYQTHYAPNRALTVVAGQFDEDWLVARLEEAFGALTPGAGPPPPADADPAWEEASRVELRHPRISTENLMLAWRSPGLTHPDTPALVLLAALLSAGQSSPLHRRIVLDGLGAHAASFLMDLEMMLVSPGLLLVDIGLQHGVPAERGEEAVQGLLTELAAQGPRAEDLERAHNQIRLSFHASLTTNMSLARHVGGYLVACGDPGFGERLLRQIAAVTRDDLMAALHAYVTGAPCLAVMQRPAGPNGDAS